MKQTNLHIPQTLLLACLVLTIGCETSFDPFQDSERAISVMGYLDVSQDTQFVRVEMLRDSLLLGSAGPLDVEVLLQNQMTGSVDAWQDSVFQFGEEVFVHNFWSPTKILSGVPYQFTVQPAAGQPVSATVTMPGPFNLASFPEITCVTLSRDCVDLPFFQLDFENVDRVAAMLMIYRYPDFDREEGCKELAIHYWEEAVEAPFGSSVVINWRDDLSRLISSWPNIAVPPTFATIDVFVAAGGPEWPDFVGIDRETLFIPDLFTNIDNGIGFLGGVLSTQIRLYDNDPFCDFRAPEIGGG